MPCVERLVQQVPELQPAASQAGGVGVGTEALRYLLGEGVFNYSTQNWSHRWSCWRRKPSKLEKHLHRHCRAQLSVEHCTCSFSWSSTEWKSSKPWGLSVP